MKNLNENHLKAGMALLCMAFLVYTGSSLLRRARFDLTEEKLYTLSPGTKSILEQMASPVKLKLYYSKTAANKGTEGLRKFNNHFLYVRDLLEEFVANSRNNISLEVIDPRPDTEDEEDALAFGLRRFHLTETERYFFGLAAIGESGAEKIIEFFNPEQKANLEYELAKLVYTVVNPQKKTIGVISSLPVLNEELSPTLERLMRMQGRTVQGDWLAFQLLKDLYHVKALDKEAESIPAVDALAVIHPKGFSEKTLYAIDQYLVRGGKLLVLVDPNAVSDNSSFTAGGKGEVSSSPDQGFRRLMDKWGMELAPNTFVGDKYLSGVGRFSPDSPPGRILPLLQCDRRCGEAYNDPVTNNLSSAAFVFPGAIKIKETAGISFSPLLATTEKGNTYRAQGYELSNPSFLWKKFKEGSKRVPLGYKAIGKFKSAFPKGLDGKADDEKGTAEKAKSLAKSKKDGAVIVFGDVDFIADQFAFKSSFLGPALANDNSSVFINALEALAGNTDLMSVRAKGRVNRGFDVIDAIEFEAEKRTADKVRQINSNIARFQRELNELGTKAKEGNLMLLRNEGVKKKKELAKKIALLKKELRRVKREGREKVERLGAFFHYLNTLLAPALVALFGLYYSKKRKSVLKRRPEYGNNQENQKNVQNLKEAQA